MLMLCQRAQVHSLPDLKQRTEYLAEAAWQQEYFLRRKELLHRFYVCHMLIYLLAWKQRAGTIDVMYVLFCLQM